MIEWWLMIYSWLIHNWLVHDWLMIDWLIDDWLVIDWYLIDDWLMIDDLWLMIDDWWLIDWSLIIDHWWIDGLMDWWIDRLIDWSIDRLIDWFMVDWFMVDDWLPCLFHMSKGFEKLPFYSCFISVGLFCLIFATLPAAINLAVTRDKLGDKSCVLVGLWPGQWTCGWP